MNTVTFKNQSYSLSGDEHILNCFLRHGIDYPNSCKAGICQSCLIKATDGVIEPSWQDGLPETLKAQGYFLACMAKPSSHITLESPDAAECEVEARIIDLERINYNVLKIKLVVDNPEDWIPGQYLNFINSEDIVRSYSIANVPVQDGYIELHIKIYEQGAMSHWLQEKAIINMPVRIRGPFGKCYYYNPDNLAYDMLLAGTGTGLAPLIAIVKSALSQGHEGIITLVHGGRVDEDIYYAEELQTLAALFKNFNYDPCVLKSQGCYPEDDIELRVLMYLDTPGNIRAYVCGPKETTAKLKTSIFLAGVPSNLIFSDPFL